jgi:CHAT domain-containing protein
VLNRYADSIRQSCGDDNLAKILEVLDSDEEPQRARNGLKGISTWLDADAAVRDFQPEKALAILDAAHSTTSNLSPAIEARLEVARIAALFQLQRYEDAIGAARRLRSVSETRGWNDVVGRASWLAGLSLLQSGQYPAAAAQFLAAEHQFVAGRQPALAANQKSLEADAISELGDLRASLQLRVAALPVLRRAGLRNREANLLSAGSVSLRLSGFPKSAIAFLDEGAAVPTDQSDPLSLAEFRLNRSAALIDAGLMNDAISDAERGLQAADKIESQGIRERTRGYLRAIRGRAEVELEPASAARDLDEAISEASRGDFHAVLGDLYLDRARARRKLGQVAEAVSDLEAAARETVAGVEGIDAMSGRALFLSRKRRLVEEAVSLFALDLGDQEQALRWLQFARDAAAPPAKHGADLCSAGSGEFLALMALPRRVARWRCHDGGVSFDSIEIERGALSMTIETFRKQIEGGADEATLAERAGDLFEILLAPIRNEVEAGREVGIFSDGWLAGVPLAAMRDPRTGKWVGELVELPLLAELPMAGGQPPGSARAGWSSLLAVADPEVPEDLVSIFPPLPGARREGEMVARFFPHSLVLSGAEASKKRLLATWTQFDVIHIAAHGVANSVDPGRSGLVLAGTDNNALLTSDEVARLAPLHAQLVVLSACGSGRGYGTSSIGSLSAAAGFLAAGVPDVVGTMWDVDDEISLRFMEAFHRRISQGERPGSALLEARRDLVESGDRKLRVPRNWAGYFLAAGRGQERREG